MRNGRSRWEFYFRNQSPMIARKIVVHAPSIQPTPGADRNQSDAVPAIRCAFGGDRREPDCIMATVADVRRIALSLPGTVEATTDFAFSVMVDGEAKRFAWCWKERVNPKKPRVPNL